jgi:hypothetical protein
MKVFIVGLGLILVAIAPASAQWGVQTWGYSTVPSWGAPAYGRWGVFSSVHTMVAVAAGKFLIRGSGRGVVSIELGSGDGDGRV